MTKRPLTPLELALLRTVVELGDKANAVHIQMAVATDTDIVPSIGVFYTGMSRLAREGYIQHTDDRFGRRYWRPAIDLTDILAAAGAGGGGDDDEETT